MAGLISMEAIRRAADDDSSDNDNDFGGNINPVLVVIPVVVAVFILSCVIFMFLYRRRGRLFGSGNDPESASYRAPDGHRMGRSRRTGERRTEPEEGLNDLGEAPPPYIHRNSDDGPKDNVEGGNRDSSLTDNTQAVELRDMEGNAKPPEYIAEPEPAALSTHSHRQSS